MTIMVRSIAIIQVHTLRHRMNSNRRYKIGNAISTPTHLYFKFLPTRLTFPNYQSYFICVDISALAGVKAGVSWHSISIMPPGFTKLRNYIFITLKHYSLQEE